ncbi:helicase SRCAP [Trichonephila inaurata madagascariensis]|uniref:Helicase SRCAP n=1 Tax=Trichonephila inaurata madagascariensis TaxID=2747483 RepID=A0A8X6XXN8_9ARAC|nr:helicase SRCAP [Trichonephila inaurata madagascariensis]
MKKSLLLKIGWINLYQLTPVEKYALQFLESMQEPVSFEQLKLAEEQIEAHKKEWELEHLKALKEEEEWKSRQLGDDDSPLFCSREAANQVTTFSSFRFFFLICPFIRVLILSI